MIKDNWKLILFVLTAVTGAASTTGYYQAKKEILDINTKRYEEENEVRVQLAILQYKCKFGHCAD